MANEKFKLPGSSYEELIKIIRAYGHVNGPASPGEVAGLIPIHETQISRNNGFLLATGIIEGGQKKAATASGNELALALEHQLPDEVKAAWSKVVAQTEFMGRLLAAVRIRNGMEPSSLQSHVAYTAGQPNSGTVKTGSATVVEILKVAGAVEERDGKLVVTVTGGGHASASEQEPVRDEPAGVTQQIRLEPTARPEQGPESVIVQIRINIDCAVDEIPALRGNLRSLLRDLVATPVDEIGE